ncbi:MAG: AsnC family transcriptional regulator [Mailhella sp.]|nr:AsnC family transcriptional regulator [Mailhella sp.]
MNQDELDIIDRRILDIIQAGFPLVPRPYAAIAEQLNIPEEEALQRVNEMRHKKIIRRLGANFQSAKLGFRSTLCGAAVPEDKLDEFISLVNSMPGVTHNYLRNHEFNVWFTLIGPSWDAICADIRRIESETGISVMNLPASKLYKIRVDFQME